MAISLGVPVRVRTAPVCRPAVSLRPPYAPAASCGASGRSSAQYGHLPQTSPSSEHTGTITTYFNGHHIFFF